MLFSKHMRLNDEEQATKGNKQKLGTSNFEMSVFQAAQYFRVKPSSKPRDKKTIVSRAKLNVSNSEMFFSEI